MAAKDLYEKDFYKVLGVDKKAPADEIKKKYAEVNPLSFSWDKIEKRNY